MRTALQTARIALAALRKGTAWALLGLALLSPAARAANPAHISYSVGFQGVLMITDLVASTGPAAGQINLQWTAPRYTGLGAMTTYYIHVSSVANINNNGDFNNFSLPLAFFSSSTIPSPAASGVKQSMTVTGLTPCVVYYFAIRGADNGNPQAVGAWLRSAAKGFNLANFSNAACTTPKLPLPPIGVGIGVIGSSSTISWLPVAAYADGTPFVQPSSPTAAELSDYHVYRATAPVKAPWTDLAVVSSVTWSWTDQNSGPQYYYNVRAENTDGVSAASMIRAVGTQNLWVVALDNLSTLEIPVQWVAALANYNIETSSKAPDAGNRVVRDVTFEAKRGGIFWDSSVTLGGMANLLLHYDFNGASVTPSGLGVSATQPTPDNLSTFWWNGNKWVQFYGKIDQNSQTLYVQTKYLGRYQLRTAERTGAFVFNGAGISNREITPNNDGKNDTVEFKFDNPQFSEVSGKIYDLHGKLVSDMVPCSDVPQCLMWDAKSKGAVVPGGVYIYQIESEGKTYNGTVIVIK